nr:hypothetical protein [uncultured Sphingomonas sp.]
MAEITFQIGKYAADRRTVPVTFTIGEIVHKRDVNAVVDGQGAYDKAATKARVEDVANGVAQKIELGIIGVPQAALDRR